MECRVCSAPATGFHYKVTTCRACSAFFRRTCQLKLRYNCNKSGNCPVGKDNRYSCRHCRMKKCLAVGMSMDDGEPPTDIYLDPSTASTSSPLPDFDHDFFSPDNIFGNNDNFTKLLKTKLCKALNQPYNERNDASDIFLIPQMERAYKLHNSFWPCGEDTLDHGSVVDMNVMWIDLYKDILVVAEMCAEIRAFAELPFHQKAAIYMSWIMKFMQLDRCFTGVEMLGDDRDDKRMITLGGQVFSFSNSRLEMSMVTDMGEGELKDLMKSSERRQSEEFAKPFKVVKPDRFELLYMMQYAMWNVTGVKGVSKETASLAETVLERLADELVLYYKYEKKMENMTRRIYKVHSLLIGLERIVEAKKEECSMARMFKLFKMETMFCDFTDYNKLS